MDSILTSCRGRGTVMARLKESWQHWVLLNAHWTRTRCKASDSREGDVGGCGSREILGVTRRQPLTVFLDAELTDPPAFGPLARGAFWRQTDQFPRRDHRVCCSRSSSGLFFLQPPTSGTPCAQAARVLRWWYPLPMGRGAGGADRWPFRVPAIVMEPPPYAPRPPRGCAASKDTC